ncbi:MAG: hypothetical protein DRJ05_13510, partial [Bacteroidetes bacterium]
IEEYGSRISIIKHNVEKLKNFEAMMAFEAEYGIPPQEVPEFYTSYGVTWNRNKIASELPALIEKELKAGKPGKHNIFFDNYLKTGKTILGILFSSYCQRVPSAVHLKRKHAK